PSRRAARRRSPSASRAAAPSAYVLPPRSQRCPQLPPGSSTCRVGESQHHHEPANANGTIPRLTLSATYDAEHILVPRPRHAPATTGGDHAPRGRARELLRLPRKKSSLAADLTAPGAPLPAPPRSAAWWAPGSTGCPGPAAAVRNPTGPTGPPGRPAARW